MKKITVVSWNIAGGHTVNSDEHFDYAPEDLNYFAENIKKFDPDIVCLQETHTNKDRIVAKDLADLLGFNYIFNTPASPSHVDDHYELGCAIISKHEFEDEKFILYPDPDFELFFSDGRKSNHASQIDTTSKD